MPIDEVTIVRRCSHCATEIEVLKIKKDNMMLSSKELVWCPECQAERPETRDVAGRLEAIRHEQMGYPQSFTEPPVRSSSGG
jgi:hypothetical protein